MIVEMAVVVVVAVVVAVAAIPLMTRRKGTSGLINVPPCNVLKFP